MTRQVVVLNGPNLNLLGQREPDIYGRTSLADIEAACRSRATKLSLDLHSFRQTNHEGQLIDWIHETRERGAGVAINAGAWAATSIAIADALRVLKAPVIEVHISNIHRREALRHNSYVSQVAHGVIAGFGYRSYLYALDALADLLDP